MKPVKCAKVKNPCKICFQTVQPKNGLQCQGACKKWAHFKCLGYTPGKIQDIKAGLIKINCPCPDCDIDPDKKEVLTKPPFTCAKQQCPANKKPICEAPDCPKKGPPSPGSDDIDPESRSCPEDCPSNTSIDKKPSPPPCPPPADKVQEDTPEPCPPPRCCEPCPGKIPPPSCCSPPSSAKMKKRPCPPPGRDPCKPACPPPPCPPDPCKPACPPPKPRCCPPKPACPPPPCPPPPCPPRPVNCPFESCRHYLAEMAARHKCTKSKCMMSLLNTPEQNSCIKASQSHMTNIVASQVSIAKPTRSDSELVTGKHDEAKTRILNAMDEMCHTVGLFQNQFRDLMGRMMIALEKC